MYDGLLIDTDTQVLPPRRPFGHSPQHSLTSRTLPLYSSPPSVSSPQTILLNPVGHLALPVQPSDILLMDHHAPTGTPDALETSFDPSQEPSEISPQRNPPRPSIYLSRQCTSGIAGPASHLASLNFQVSRKHRQQPSSPARSGF
ncbi:hypothetical protein PGT21_024709 [Puccinia graminis f. sp. tritici]|uniref:Uncharacterized protein n=1 Tax=Puccinia graminis f. sp. tritici TaxID=56615 RepID=A0A5B0ME71_PUCGR|nr:hypothetical protein PGT21_024709 [Puccinia graminis f. sp. tritici]